MPKTMRAAVTVAWNEVRVMEVPVPALRPGEVLCRVRACGICGTDLKIMAGVFADSKKWPRELPFIQGHEWSGEVVALGPGVTQEDIKIGDRVVGESHMFCGTCRMCQEGNYHMCDRAGGEKAYEKGFYLYGHDAPGAFAEYVARPLSLLYRVPESLSWEEAAIGNQAAVALHLADRGDIKAGYKVVVLGPGHLGLLSLQIAKAMGATTVIVTGRDDQRLALARELGADYTVDIREDAPERRILELTGGGADVVLECAGTPEAVCTALEVARKGGKVVLGGLTGGKQVAIDPDKLVLKELDVRGSHARVNSQTRALEMIAKGLINARKLVSFTFPLEEINKAYNTFKDRNNRAIRVIVQP
ncbi:hypothetical protein SY88_12420 [Clostridiales bacterium PH28_bin88]|nr:hypothetical protein SY88_12420 [Clostridiales bacterium PH28_bin88]